MIRFVAGTVHVLCGASETAFKVMSTRHTTAPEMVTVPEFVPQLKVPNVPLIVSVAIVTVDTPVNWKVFEPTLTTMSSVEFGTEAGLQLDASDQLPPVAAPTQVLKAAFTPIAPKSIIPTIKAKIRRPLLPDTMLPIVVVIDFFI